MTVVKEKLETTRRPYRFSYRQLLEMDRAGILGDKRVELIDGELIAMSPPNPPHAIATTELDNSLTLALADRAKVSVQNPIRLSPDMEDRNLPLPDLAVIERKTYRDHPQPEDVFVLIEVADTSLADDRGRKLSLYAEHGIFEYWIVNLIDKQIEVYTEPKGEEYLTRHTYGLTERFAPARFPDLVRQWLPEELLELLSQDNKLS
jgi:Uma2 family endonuclease